MQRESLFDCLAWHKQWVCTYLLYQTCRLHFSLQALLCFTVNVCRRPLSVWFNTCCYLSLHLSSICSFSFLTSLAHICICCKPASMYITIDLPSYLEMQQLLQLANWRHIFMQQILNVATRQELDVACSSCSSCSACSACSLPSISCRVCAGCLIWCWMLCDIIQSRYRVL